MNESIPASNSSNGVKGKNGSAGEITRDSSKRPDEEEEGSNRRTMVQALLYLSEEENIKTELYNVISGHLNRNKKLHEMGGKRWSSMSYRLEDQLSSLFSNWVATKKVLKPPPINIRFPNASVGKEYDEVITIDDDSSNLNLKINKIEGLNDLGLRAEIMQDGKSVRVTGGPRKGKDGHHEIKIYWEPCDESWEEQVYSCDLIINPDPRDLWKNEEPDENAPFHKVNHHEKYLSMSKTKRIMLGASRRGRSHENKGTHREDHFEFAYCKKTKWSILAVADGGGSYKYSREGSKIAAESVVTELKELLSGEHGAEFADNVRDWEHQQTKLSKELPEKFNEVALSAISKIEDTVISFNNDPANSDEQVKSDDFNTTLLFAVVYECEDQTFVATYWIGDGAIAVLGTKEADISLRLMGEPDGGEYAGQVTFLSTDAVINKHNNSRIGCFKHIDAVILMTDGISDPKFGADANLADEKRWQELWAEHLGIIAKAGDPELAKKELFEWMSFESPGEHDDRTIAIYC